MTDSHDSAIGPAESYPAGPIDSGTSALPGASHAEAGSATEAEAASTAPPADPVLTEPAGQLVNDQQLTSPRHGWPGRAWRGFRTWRRSRPFWGGLLVLLAAGEIFLTERAPIAIIVHLGAQGLAGYLLPIVMGVCALLLWFNPGQRMFYAIISVLAALGSFIVSNLGGFLIGMLLGVLGGSLAFAWTPLPPGAQAKRRGRHRPVAPASTSAGLSPFLSGEDVPGPLEGTPYAAKTAETAPDAVDPSVGVHPGSGGAASRSDAASYGSASADNGIVARSLDPADRPAPTDARLVPPYMSGPDRGTIIGGNILISLLSLLTGGLLNLTPTTAPTQSADLPAATASPSASTSASPSPSASPSASATPSVSASPGQSPGASASPPAGTSPSASASPSQAPTGIPPPFVISAAQSTLTASSASITGFVYDGVVSVPTASGNVQMMQFSATALDLNGVRLAVSQGGGTLTTTATALDLNGRVVLYATELSGDLLGIPITITPNTPLATILQILGQVGVSQAIPLEMTNVTTLQPFTSATGMTASALLMS